VTGNLIDMQLDGTGNAVTGILRRSLWLTWNNMNLAPTSAA
jgi:hypothetical protein